MVRGGVGPSSSPPPTHKLGVSDPKKIMNGFKNRLVHDWDMKGQTPAYHNYIEAAKTVTDRMAAYWKAERAFSKDPSDEQTMATLVYARRAYRLFLQGYRGETNPRWSILHDRHYSFDRNTSVKIPFEANLIRLWKKYPVVVRYKDHQPPPNHHHEPGMTSSRD